MKETVLKKLEKAVESAGGLDAKKKQEILDLIGHLRQDTAEAKSEAVESGVEDLQESILGFEASHPELVEMTNRACKMLSDIGI